MKRRDVKAMLCDGNIFKLKRVISWAQRLNELFCSSMELVFMEFKNHANPIIPATDLQQFIDKAPSIF